jgi:hypothetical protein
MALIPKSKKPQTFDRELDGVYGHFKTTQSFSLHYLLTSIRTDRLDWLETASDVLDIKSINFEGIVQRDINYVRVQKEIIEKYLEKGKDRVIFFPPLMVTLYGMNGESPITKYTTVESQMEDERYLVTYDKNRFQTELPIAEYQTAHFVIYNKQQYFYHNYAATLRYNTEKVRLVVLDGQHRLTALKMLIENGDKDIVAEIDLPICIFFAPDAISGKSQETLSEDMRELFVTINKEAKEVSGHFLWLLKDKSLAAMCVRSLGDLWKKEGGVFSYLHQLEWNQREASKADQTQKVYSISTVSILADALKTHIFTGKKNYTYSLLNLGEVEQELQKVEGSPQAGDVSEDDFDLDQADILKKQIDKYITPSLDVLFRTPRPYRIVREVFEKATSLLEDSLAKNIPGALQFKKDFLCKFRTVTKLDSAKVQDQEVEFTAPMQKNKELEKVAFFRRNVFQQALIRAWADLFNCVRTEKTATPKEVAEALVTALELICFDESVKYFGPYKPYAQLVFYKGERILVNGSSKTGLRHLILASFANEKVSSEFVKKLGFKNANVKLLKSLRDFGSKAVAEYLDIFVTNQTKTLHREWKFADLGVRDLTYLEERYDSTDPKNIKEFKDRIEEISNKKLLKAKEVLTNILGIKPSDVPISNAGDVESDIGVDL